MEKSAIGSLGPWCWRKVTFWELMSVKLLAGHVGENREGFLKKVGTDIAFDKQCPQFTSLKSSQVGWEEVG